MQPLLRRVSVLYIHSGVSLCVNHVIINGHNVAEVRRETCAIIHRKKDRSTYVSYVVDRLSNIQCRFALSNQLLLLQYWNFRRRQVRVDVVNLLQGLHDVGFPVRPVLEFIKRSMSEAV